MRRSIRALVVSAMLLALVVGVVVGETITSPTVGDLIHVPAGRFQRDANPANTSEVGSFWMSRYEITRRQFVAIMGADPSEATRSHGPDDPVQRVNWYHAIAFANRLSLAEGLTPVYSVTVNGSPVNWQTLRLAQIPTSQNGDWNRATANWDANGYRLPTEMEWMWAAMGAPADGQNGGTNRTGYRMAFAGDMGTGTVDASVWHKGNSGGKTHPVGLKQPSSLGFYDLSGNVKEWSWDLYGETLPQGALVDYRGPGSGSLRVNRGGSVALEAQYAAVSARNGNHPYLMSNNTGIRLVRRADGASSAGVSPTAATTKSGSAATAYRVGDTGPAGGLIFFVDTGDAYPGFDYLEAAPTTPYPGGETWAWWGPSSPLNTAATATGLGAGRANTAALVGAFRGFEGSAGYPYAAHFCDSLVLGGYDDWYLPSRDELELMRTVLFDRGLGAFTGSYYWSSTEHDALTARTSYFSGSGSAGYMARSNAFYVRAIRQF